jgi:aromatic-L-amino-acid/L-tryptophan decarboxylase
VNNDNHHHSRTAPLDISSERFRALGHRLIDEIADFLGSLHTRPVTPAESPAQVRAAFDAARPLPEDGTDPQALLNRAASLLFDHSLFNGHPRFYGYITAGPAPIGILADLLAAAVNPNTGAWKLSPLATEIEAQTIRWLAQFIGYYPASCGGLLVSGGNMANLTGFLAARAAAHPAVRKQGVAGAPDSPRLCLYASPETHTWLHKAADLTGLGTDAIHWVPSLDLNELEARYRQDKSDGFQPFLVVGSAGTVSTGAVDPLPALAAFSKRHHLWFHVDGAYGAFAVAAPGTPEELKGLQLADSIAVDPHKWLYAPLEAGCALVRDPASLTAAFSYHPPYYNFSQDDIINYYDIGPQNSRGFRALKVWLALQHAGASGYRKMIQDDIALARRLYHLAAAHPQLEALTHNLSITTLRYVPADLRPTLGIQSTEDYLNDLNQHLLAAIEESGEAFISNAVLPGGKYALRACIVNFRTSAADIEALSHLIVRLGRQVDAGLRRQTAPALAAE